jgi:hypothetical protein
MEREEERLRDSERGLSWGYKRKERVGGGSREIVCVGARG